MLVTYTLEEENKWEEVVKSFKDFDVYYLPSYVKAFKLHGDGEPMLFHYEYNNLRAINVVMKRDIANHQSFLGKLKKDTVFDLSTPYGYGGFIFEGNVTEDNLKQFDIDYTRYCKKENIISEFVRFHPVLNNAKIAEGIYEVITLGKTVTLKLESRDQIWNNLKSKNRNVIRKAKKSGVEIRWGNDSKLFETFVPMYNATMDKDKANKYYYFDESFYQSIQDDMKYNMLFFYAYLEDEIVSMAMITFANRNMHYHLSASNPEFNRYSPSNLLLNEVANWGVENGFTKFHLGGGVGSKEDNLFKFKSSFTKGGNTCFSIGKKIFNQEVYDNLVSLKFAEKSHDITEINFFPKYRGTTLKE